MYVRPDFEDGVNLGRFSGGEAQRSEVTRVSSGGVSDDDTWAAANRSKRAPKPKDASAFLGRAAATSVVSC